MADGIGKALTFYCRYPEEMDEIGDGSEYMNDLLDQLDVDKKLVEKKSERVSLQAIDELIDLWVQCTDKLGNHLSVANNFCMKKMKKNNEWFPKWWLVKDRLEIGLEIYTENKSLVAYSWVWMKGGQNVEKYLCEDVLMGEPVESSKRMAGGRTITIKKVNINVPDGEDNLDSEDIVSLLTSPFLDINKKKWKLACDKAVQNKRSKKI